MTSAQEIASKLGLSVEQVEGVLAFEASYVAPIIEETGTWEIRDLFADKIEARRAELAARRAAGGNAA
jgi:hypothetical protein